MLPTTASFDPSIIFEILFYVAALVFIIHASVMAYHWYSFGADRKTSLLGIAIHLIVGAVFLLMLSIILYQI